MAKKFQEILKFTTGERGVGDTSNSLASAYGRHDRDLRAIRDFRCESARVAAVLVSHEDIDVLPHMPLFGQNSISQTGKGSGQSRQRFPQGLSCELNLNLSSPIRKLAQRSGQVERDRH